MAGMTASRDAGNGGPNRDVRPVPDPTSLTTSQLHSVTLSLREILEARIIGMERDIARLQGSVEVCPRLIEERVVHLESLHGEKFRSIDTQFRERDVRTEQTAKDTKVAVDAALQAAEKARSASNESFAIATSKSEAATTKQIDQQGLLITTTTAGLKDQIEDIKVRLSGLKDDMMKEILTLRESNSRGEGGSNQEAMGRANAQYMGMMIVAVLGLVVTAIVGALAYFAGKP